MKSRVSGSLDGTINRAVGRQVAGPVDFLARYEGRVVKQSADGKTVDVQLDIDTGDGSGIPSPSVVELRHGIPGATVFVQAGARVLVGWVGGDQRQPFAELWRDGAHTTKLVLSADDIYLVAETGSEPAALGQTLKTFLDSLRTWATSHTHVVAGVQAGAGSITSATGLPVPPTVPDVRAGHTHVK